MVPHPQGSQHFPWIKFHDFPWLSHNFSVIDEEQQQGIFFFFRLDYFSISGKCFFFHIPGFPGRLGTLLKAGIHLRLRTQSPKVAFFGITPTHHPVFGQCTGSVLFGSVRNCANLVQSVDQVDMWRAWQCIKLEMASDPANQCQCFVVPSDLRFQSPSTAPINCHTRVPLSLATSG